MKYTFFIVIISDKRLKYYANEKCLRKLFNFLFFQYIYKSSAWNGSVFFLSVN